MSGTMKRLQNSLRVVPGTLACVLLGGAASAQFTANTSDIPTGGSANGSNTENVDFGDVDLDGDWDAVFADGGDNAQDQNRIWINRGPGANLGKFLDETSSRFPSINDQSRDIEFVDFDNDADLDIYISNTAAIVAQGNRWWRNTGGGNYVDETAARWVGLASSNSSIAGSQLLGSGSFIDFSCDCDFGDLDNDGDMDLFHSSYGGIFGGQVPSRIFLNDGAGFFEEVNPSGFKLLGQTIQPNNPGLWCEGTQQSDTTNTTGARCDIASSALDIDLGDLDGDFDLDVLHGARQEAPRIFMNRLGENGGVLGFRDVTTAAFPVGYTAGNGHYEQEMGDMDGDGDLDIYGLNWNANFGLTDITLRNDGTGQFDALTNLPNSASDDNEGDFIDFDNDGDNDLFIANFSGQDRLYENDGAGNFRDVTDGSGAGDTGQEAHLLFADDDNDSDLDLYVASMPAAGIVQRLYRNEAGESFTMFADGIEPLEWSSAAWGDYDADGDLGLAIMGFTNDGLTVTRIYRLDGTNQFTPLSHEVRGGRKGSLAWGDYDNDGDLDLYLNNFGPNVLYRNEGNGTFTDVTAMSGTQNGNRTGAGASFLDVDADGDLDLYVANYIKFSFANHVPRTKKGHPINGGPKDYEPDSDSLFRNNGDGTFTDISEQSGLTKHAAPGMGMVCPDYDADGDTDVFVANDGYANFLFRNDGKGRFQEAGLISGFAYDGLGQTHGSMGVDSADMDNDGLPDFHVTSFQGELATLYRNSKGGFLEDVTNVSGAGVGTRALVTWGNGFVDFDNDGDRDIFIGSGHVYDTVHLFDKTSSYELFNLVLENRGRGKFTNVSTKAGNGMRVKLSTRGAAFDDLDQDGDIDVVLLNSRREPTLLRNESLGDHHWLRVRLQGTSTNRDGVGSKIEVRCGDLVQFDEVHSGRGYQGHYGSTVHFGLGNNTRIDLVRVHWHGGGIDELRNLPVDQSLTIKQTVGGKR